MSGRERKAPIRPRTGFGGPKPKAEKKPKDEKKPEAKEQKQPEPKKATKEKDSGDQAERG